MRTRTTPALLGVAVLALTACGEDEPAAPVTETVTATPEVEDEPAQTPESEAAAEGSQTDEEWLEAMREDHIDGIMEWWDAFYESGCEASDPECWDWFAEGRPLVENYKDALSGDDDYMEDMQAGHPHTPDFVTPEYHASVVVANNDFSVWELSCPVLESDTCVEAARDVHGSMMDVLVQTVMWESWED